MEYNDNADTETWASGFRLTVGSGCDKLTVKPWRTRPSNKRWH